MLRAVLGDPEPFFAEALTVALHEHDVEVVGTARGARDVERLALESPVDVVLTERSLAPGSGLELASRIGAQVPVVLLTREHEGDVLLDAAAAGAAGCLGHGIALSRLAALLHGARPGQFLVDEQRLQPSLLRAARRGVSEEASADSPLGALTAREREVFDLLGLGLDNATIADQLHVSPHTVRTHVGRILRKLGVRSRAQAVRVAAREGVAPRPGSSLLGPRLGGTSGG